MRAAEHLPLVHADYDRLICLVIPSVYLGSDNVGSMEGMDKYAQVGMSTRNLLTRKINKSTEELFISLW